VTGLRDRLTAILDPLTDWSPEHPAVRSDFDLNPDMRPTAALSPRHAAVLVPIVDLPEGPSLLLTRRSDALSSHSGQIAFPGGRLEPGETAVEAALREAWEEVGLDAHHVEPLGLSDTHETGTGFLVTPVVAWVRPGFNLVADPSEVAEVFEVPWDFLMNPANHREDHYTTPEGQLRRFWAMPWNERYIWGATAGMLRALHTRLEDAA
jgi:8-oxo-dGTP pyrophosphatase MutT (NUDIX family)